MKEFLRIYELGGKPMAVPAMKLAPIVGELHLKCPDCDGSRLVATTSSCVVPGGGYWLSDGDTIFGLEAELTNAGLESPLYGDEVPEVMGNYDYELLVGECPSCESEYFVVQAKMIDESVTIDSKFVQTYFFENLPHEEPSYLVGAIEGKDDQWLVTRVETPIGIMLGHTFGPFSLSGDTLKGPFGVSSCAGDQGHWEFARQYLFDRWASLKALSKTA